MTDLASSQTIKRTHDRLYLEGGRRNKEYFKMIWKSIKSDFGDKKISLLDIGCASGDFIYFTKEEFPNISFTGLDVMQELLDRINFAGVQKICGDISNRDSLPNKKFDCLTMLGVLSIFDDFITVLDNAVEMLDEEGVFYLFGIFNPENIDVYIKSKPSGIESYKNAVLESGWNIISIKSIELFCASRGMSCKFEPFECSIDLDKNQADPLRSWTIDINGKRQIVNGLQIIHRFFLCRISKENSRKGD